MRITVETIETLGGLRRIEHEWSALGPATPMQSPAWLVSWWEAFGEQDPALRLLTLALRDESDALVGLAPFYMQNRSLVGATLRLLGDGRAATDHQTLLTTSPEHEPAVVSATARWLAETAGAVWRRIRFEALDDRERAFHHLERLLEEADVETEWVDCVGSYRFDMPTGGGWEEYLGELSKNRRKKLRRWERAWFETGRAQTRVVEDLDGLRDAWPLLARLNQQRRAARGERGVFECERFDRFLRSAGRRLLEEQRLYLSLTTLDGQPAAAEFALQDEHAVYAYQGGIAGWAHDEDAGHLSLMALWRHALESGRTRLDLLRGDEPYKLSWGASRHATRTLHARPRDLAARIEGWASGVYRRARDSRRAAEAG